eukprot:TRINITY_DN17997_c0_g1_i1.p1 TRINITY_DN17997_c0_g1~~TRINITY_DN17997_c0_g1_i1.p1  ORF type:complete len:479 (-),score=54.34 TRINITY_DN17997_c0_g1_i1:90-1502(-)
MNGLGSDIFYRADVAYLGGDAVYCVYCPPASKDKMPFVEAKKAHEEVLGVSILELERQGRAEGFDGAMLPRPETWSDLYLPAARMYRLRASCTDSPCPSICVAGFGTNKESFLRASCVALAAAGVVIDRRPLSQRMLQDIIFQKVVEGIRSMVECSAPSLWDEDCWFASHAEMNGYRSRLQRFVPQGEANPCFTNVQVQGILEKSELPREDLSCIWRLTYQDSNWALPPLLCAMALAARRRRGMVLPEVLPEDLRDMAEEVCASAASPPPGRCEEAGENASSDEESDCEEDLCEYDGSLGKAWGSGLPEHPWVDECARFYADGIRSIGREHTTWIPIMCLRWTHDGIHGQLCFQSGARITDLVLSMWRSGYTYSPHVPALDVVVDEAGNFWCLSNRRLAAYRMLQSLCAETVWAECYVYGTSHRKFASSKTTRNGGIGVVPNDRKFSSARPTRDGGPRFVPNDRQWSSHR